ncbi:MAG TPA: HDOD domain-containing protein [Acidimicrobiia bacterium]|nr:HDOD domain-containing protein [Acidimicrobiia bacterium]
MFVGDVDGLPFPATATGRFVLCRTPSDAWDRLGGDDVSAVVAVGLPGMEGLRLLNRLRADYPSAARIVVDPAPGAVFRLRHAELAHQVLSARWEPKLLWNAVTRTVELKELLPDQRLRALVGGVETLPSVPPIFLELTRVIESPTCGAAEIAAVVGRDPALTAKVLQLVNSSFFGLTRRVSAIDTAVAYLGVTTLRALVLSSEAFSLFRPPAAAGLDLADLAARSVATARAAAARAVAAERDDAFAAGLLCDLGLVVLAARAPELSGCDESVLGVSHGDAGAYLLGLWGLPTTVVDAVAAHHRAAADQRATGLCAVDAVSRAVSEMELGPVVSG